MIAKVEPLTSTRMLDGPFDYRLPAEMCEQATVGTLLVVPFGKREILGVLIAIVERSDVPAERLLAPVRLLDLSLPSELVELAGWIAKEYCSTVARALRLMMPPAITKGQLAGKPRRLVRRRPDHQPVGTVRGEPPVLTGAQQTVLTDLAVALAAPESATRLLHGVTGSGKTEVYLQAAMLALERGRSVIVMVPEIALTPQIVTRFIDRFGDTVAVLHSRLRPAERREEWRRLRAGEARVCIGPRSAVFAPLDDPGLIVIDEEHDGSYKHDSDPRYDAREIAGWRAHHAGAVLVAGSATPRAESMHRMRCLRLPERVDGRPLPHVELLDMRGQRSGLHPASSQALVDLRAERGKAIVLLNRRGWSNFLTCRACGHVWECPNCDVALVLHRGLNRLACHHCDHRQKIPTACDCGCTTLSRHGAGTERLQYDLTALLQDDGFPVFRLDTDTTAGADNGKEDGEPPANRVSEILSRFERASAGVLIGTQMVAKGHDFSDVRLGLVLDADATLRFPDFRAEERTFALITQLAGRVGRDAAGRVLVQTISPNARSITHAAKHDSDGFTGGELARRKTLTYPPYGHLIRIVCSAVDGEEAHAAATALHAMLADRLHGHQSPSGFAVQSAEGTMLLGPTPLMRLRGRDRHALLVKTARRRPAVAAVGRAVRDLARRPAHRAVNFAVDVEPR